MCVVLVCVARALSRPERATTARTPECDNVNSNLQVPISLSLVAYCNCAARIGIVAEPLKEHCRHTPHAQPTCAQKKRIQQRIRFPKHAVGNSLCVVSVCEAKRQARKHAIALPAERRAVGDGKTNSYDTHPNTSFEPMRQSTSDIHLASAHQHLKQSMDITATVFVRIVNVRYPTPKCSLPMPSSARLSSVYNDKSATWREARTYDRHARICGMEHTPQHMAATRIINRVNAETLLTFVRPHSRPYTEYVSRERRLLDSKSAGSHMKTSGNRWLRKRHATRRNAERCICSLGEYLSEVRWEQEVIVARDVGRAIKYRMAGGR